MPPLRIFHQLLTQQAEPAVTYYVRGTSTNIGGTETFNIQYIRDGASTPDAATTETVQVAADGSWEFEYSGKKIYSLETFAYNNTTITSADFSASDDLTQCTSLQSAFESTSGMLSLTFVQTLENVTNGSRAFHFCGNNVVLSMNNATFANLLIGGRMFVCDTTTISLPSATFASLTDANNDNNLGFGGMFQSRTEISHKPHTINLPSATFANLTNAVSMFYNQPQLTTLTMPLATFASVTNAMQMFSTCSQLQAMALPSATFASVTNAESMFENCTSVTSCDLSAATFGNVLTASRMFIGFGSNLAFTLPIATFASLTTAGRMFRGGFASISMPLATFANMINSNTENNAIYGAMFSRIVAKTISMPSATFGNLANALGMFNECMQLETLTLSVATFASASNTQSMFSSCSKLTDIVLTQVDTAILPTSTPANAPLDLRAAPLTYASMLNVANWVSDMSGQSAHTCTFKTSAWNALTAAEQANIDAILTAKNWTRALA